MKPGLTAVVPLLPTGAPLAEALAFYTQHLGFSVTWQSPTMAGLRRDGVALNLVENVTREWVDNASVSIGVTDLDALYEEYRRAPARVGPLEVKPWGRREFHLAIAGVCLQFHQA
jgi:hypothetical protein